MSSVELNVVDKSGKKVSSRQVDAGVVGKQVKTSVLHQTVRWQRSKKRAGTHSTLTRAQVKGGGVKPWKQKGTGRARAGSNTSPLWVGGGIAHGPKPRSYEFRMNKKERRAALCGAISTRQAESRLFILDALNLAEAKTKHAVAIIKGLGIEQGKSVLVVVEESNENAVKSLRNIDRVDVISPKGLNVYDVLNHQFLVFTGEAFKAVEDRLKQS